MSGQATALPLAGPGQRHLLDQLVQFSGALHTAGLQVNPSKLIDLCRCMPFIDIRNRADFHAAARATLVASQSEIAVFDRMFREFWDQPRRTASRSRNPSDPQDRIESGSDEGQISRILPQPGLNGNMRQAGAEKDPPAYSLEQSLTRKDFALMSDGELEQARRLVAELIAILANHPGRRVRSSHKRSDPDLRRMLRCNALLGLDAMEFRYREKRIRKTRLLLLCDVSGSMERYSRFLIQFIYALRQQLPRLDVAVFSTRMTVITDYLRRQSPEQSMRNLAAQVHDWGGGTDLGGCLQEFNHRFGFRARRSHTVAVILSDGWDRGDPSHIREEMQRLHSQVHRVLWLNPLLGHDNYQPLCQGIRMALPFIHHFLPAHNLESLAELIRRLRTVWR